MQSALTLRKDTTSQLSLLNYPPPLLFLFCILPGRVLVAQVTSSLLSCLILLRPGATVECVTTLSFKVTETTPELAQVIWSSQPLLSGFLWLHRKTGSWQCQVFSLPVSILASFLPLLFVHVYFRSSFSASRKMSSGTWIKI